MSANQTRPDRAAQPAQENWEWPAGEEPQSDNRRHPSLTLAGLGLLTVIVVCVAAFLVVRVFFPSALASVLPGTGGGGVLATPSGLASPSGSPSSGKATVAVEPPQGLLGSLVTVSGQGWLPGEPVFVFLRPPDEPNSRGYSYAAGVADDSGSFQAAFTFPQEPRWANQQWAEVIARGSRSNLEATTRFTLLAPTSTSSPLPTVRPISTPTGTPAPTEPPTPTPLPIITDWRGEYFANLTLAGSPVLIRNDQSIDFDWGLGAPAANLPADGFSARWTRLMAFRAGNYRFTAGADDGVRVLVDGRLYVSEWHDSGFTLYSFDLALDAGDHAIQVEYYEDTGSARVLFAWAPVAPTQTPTPTGTPTPTDTSTPTDTPAPTQTPTPTDTPTSTATPASTTEPTSTPSPTSTPPPAQLGPWQGEYFDNPALLGDPLIIRDDSVLDFDWGTGSPAPGIGADHFSARWTTSAVLAGGTYHFRVDVDDGVRVSVDGKLLIDEWHFSGGATYVADVQVAAGTHQVRVDYFEDVGNALIRVTVEALP